MTLPHERTRAVLRAADFLRDLCDPKKTPRVPREVRERAGIILKHYPWKTDLLLVAHLAPNIFSSLIKTSAAQRSKARPATGASKEPARQSGCPCSL